MANEARSFKVVVSGQFAAFHDSGTQTLKNYREEFILKSQEAALSLICKHLLTPRLKSVYPDFIRFRTHKLESIAVVGRAPDQAVLQLSLEDMTIPELQDFCILKGITIDPALTKPTKKELEACKGDKEAAQALAMEHCRERITEAWRNKRDQAKHEKASGQETAQKEVDELMAMNQVSRETSDVVNVNDQKLRLAQKGKPGRKPKVVKGAPAYIPAPGEEDPLPLEDADAIA